MISNSPVFAVSHLKVVLTVGCTEMSKYCLCGCFGFLCVVTRLLAKKQSFVCLEHSAVFIFLNLF